MIQASQRALGNRAQMNAASGRDHAAREDGAPEYIGWLGVVRLGLVQTALGAIVVLTTATLNRVMVIELGWMALAPAALVAFHYAVQVSRPLWGWGSDQSYERGGRRTPWILGGMAVLASGGVLAAVSVAWMASDPVAGLALAAVAFLLIGVGVGAAGTTLLALLAARVAPARRPAAASVVWIMMIAGFAVTGVSVGALLDPFSFERLVAVAAGVSVTAMLVTVLALWGVEPRFAASRMRHATSLQPAPAAAPAFWSSLQAVWADDDARRFTLFVFVAMLAYNAQDVVLEPFSGYVFGLTVGGSTQLSGVHHGGVLAGLLLVAFLGRRFGSLRLWTTGGCLLSALAFVGLSISAFVGPGWPLHANVFALGVSNGAFAGAAIASMMALAGAAGPGKAGVRMGVWGAAQAFGFGLAGLLGAATKDVTIALNGSEPLAYATVFALETVLFVAAAALASAVGGATSGGMARNTPIASDFDAVEIAR